MPRAGLTRSRVVEEAEQIIDEEGLSHLTLAALAQRLGVRQPSLYKHVDGMADLQRSITLRAKQELADTLARATVGKSRADAIMSMARVYRRWALEHPGRYAATQRSFTPEDVESEIADHAVVQIVSDVLNGYDLHEDDATDAIRALRAALHGFVVLETGGGFGLPADIDRSFERLISGLEMTLPRWTEQRKSSSRV
ncbi:MAG: TetR/AcrR family transcriptional regulator [Acidimicrobiales bacterium]